VNAKWSKGGLFTLMDELVKKEKSGSIGPGHKGEGMDMCKMKGNSGTVIKLQGRRDISIARGGGGGDGSPHTEMITKTRTKKRGGGTVGGVS